MNKLFTLLAVFLVTCSMAFANQEDVSVSHRDIGNGCLSTIDIRMTERIANQDDLIIDYNYQSIKDEGITMNVYYAQAMGKAQWTPFTSMRGIYIMRSSASNSFKLGIETTNSINKGGYLTDCFVSKIKISRCT